VLVERTRPFLVLTGTRIIGWRERGKSFPSGHTSQAFFMATLLAQYFQAGAMITGLLYFVAITVAVTRVYVGAHYPRDVIAGALLGSVWGLITNLI
jgi:membrane-associated phospholipid phosphatase